MILVHTYAQFKRFLFIGLLIMHSIFSSITPTHLYILKGALLMSNKHISVPSDILDNVHGPLPIPMTNDYLFRALMQQNNRVLRALICSLLHLDDAEVSSVVISNPIELGKNIDDKTYILDIKVSLNGLPTVSGQP